MCTGINAPSGCVPGTKMISVGDDGAAANAPSSSPSISGDGRYIAFVSAATNLAATPISSGPQVYIRDTCEGPTGTKSCVPSTLSVQVDEEDQLASAQAGRPAISSDGRYVAYEIWTAQSVAQSRLSPLHKSSSPIRAWASKSPSFATRPRREFPRRPTARTSAAPIFCLPSVVTAASWPSNRNRAESANATTGSTSKAFLRDTCVGPTAPDGCTPSTIQIATDASASAAKSQSFSPAVSASGRYVSFVSGIVSGAPAGEVATEGSLLVRDTCFAATLPCTPRTYMVPSSAAALSAAHVPLASFSTANSPKAGAAGRGQVQRCSHQFRRAFRRLLRSRHNRGATRKRHRRRIPDHHTVPVIHDT